MRQLSRVAESLSLNSDVADVRRAASGQRADGGQSGTTPHRSVTVPRIAAEANEDGVLDGQDRSLRARCARQSSSRRDRLVLEGLRVPHEVLHVRGRLSPSGAAVSASEERRAAEGAMGALRPGGTSRARPRRPRQLPSGASRAHHHLEATSALSRPLLQRPTAPARLWPETQPSWLTLGHCGHRWPPLTQMVVSLGDGLCWARPRARDSCRLVWSFLPGYLPKRLTDRDCA